MKTDYPIDTEILYKPWRAAYFIIEHGYIKEYSPTKTYVRIASHINITGDWYLSENINVLEKLSK